MSDKFHKSTKELLKSRFDKVNAEAKKSERAHQNDRAKAKREISGLKEEIEQLRGELAVAKVYFVLCECRKFWSDKLDIGRSRVGIRRQLQTGETWRQVPEACGCSRDFATGA